MGTSTVHRSPNTPRWRIVNNLYDDPSVAPERLLAEVFNAADSYPSGLADPAVLERVVTVLRAAEEGRWRGDIEAGLRAARDAIGTAQAQAIRAGAVSFYGDLADKAVHATLVGAAREPDSGATPRSVLTAFLGNLIAAAIDHVVSRDMTAHLGGRRISRASDVLALRRVLVDQARRVAADENLSQSLEEAASSPRQHWATVVARAWEIGAVPPPMRKERTGR